METKNLIIVIAIVLCFLMFPVAYQLVKGSVNPAVGTWVYTVETPLGPWIQTLTLNADMSGTVLVTEPEAGNWPVSNAKVDGNSLSFAVLSEVEGQALTFTFKGNIDGDVLTGVYVSDFGNSRVTGTRK